MIAWHINRCVAQESTDWVRITFFSGVCRENIDILWINKTKIDIYNPEVTYNPNKIPWTLKMTTCNPTDPARFVQLKLTFFISPPYLNDLPFREMWHFELWINSSLLRAGPSTHPWNTRDSLMKYSPVIFVILLILSAWPNHLKQVLPFWISTIV